MVATLILGLTFFAITRADAQEGEQLILRSHVNSHTDACENATSHTEGNYKVMLATNSENWIQGLKIIDQNEGSSKRYSLKQVGSSEDPSYSFNAVFYRKFMKNLVSLSGSHLSADRPIKMSLTLMHHWRGGFSFDFRKLPLLLKPEGDSYVLYTDTDGSNAFDDMTFESLCEEVGDSVAERGISKIILKRNGSVVQTIDVDSEL